MAKRLTEDEFIQWLTRRADRYRNRQAFARALGVSAGYLSDVLNQHRPPSAKFLEKVRAREVRFFEVDAA